GIKPLLGRVQRGLADNSRPAKRSTRDLILRRRSGKCQGQHRARSAAVNIRSRWRCSADLQEVKYRRRRRCAGGSGATMKLEPRACPAGAYVPAWSDTRPDRANEEVRSRRPKLKRRPAEQERARRRTEGLMRPRVTGRPAGGAPLFVVTLSVRR